MDFKRPKLRWLPSAEEHIRQRHHVRPETLEALLDAEDLSMVGSRFGRLLLQGAVDGKGYRMVVEVVDRDQWILQPVTGYRYAAGDRKRGGTR